jgi:hypothetical protein
MSVQDLIAKLSEMTGHQFGPLDAMAGGFSSSPTGPLKDIGSQMQALIGEAPELTSSWGESMGRASAAGSRVDEQDARLSAAQAKLEASGRLGGAATPKTKALPAILAAVSDAMYELGRGVDTPRSNFSGQVAQTASMNADRANRRAEIEAQAELARAGQVYGTESELALQERGLAFDEQQEALNRADQTAGRYSDQDFIRSEREGTQGWTSGENVLGREHEADMQATGIGAASDLSTQEHGQQMEAMGFDRETQTTLTTMGFDHDVQMQIAQQTFENAQREFESSDIMDRLLQEGELAVDRLNIQGMQQDEIQRLIGRQAMGQLVEKGSIDMNLLDADGRIKVALLTQEGSQTMDQIHAQHTNQLQLEGQAFSHAMKKMAVMDAKSTGLSPSEGFTEMPWEEMAMTTLRHSSGIMDQWYQGKAPEDLSAREARGEPYFAEATSLIEGYKADPTAMDIDQFGAKIATSLRMLDRYLPEEAYRIRMDMKDLMPSLSEAYHKKKDPRGFFGSMYTGLLMTSPAGYKKAAERIRLGVSYETGSAKDDADAEAQSWADEWIDR